MNKKEREILEKMGFHLANGEGNKRRSYWARGWTRRFIRGDFIAVLYVQKEGLLFKYRVHIENTEEASDDSGLWFDAEDLCRIKALRRKVNRVHRKVRRRLEGCVAVRWFRRLILR